MPFRISQYLHSSPFVFFLLLFVSSLSAQTENPRNEAWIYDDEVHSVQLHLTGASQTFPIVDLKAGKGVLLLEFDHMGTDIHDYVYTLVHCNSDWQPSDLLETEYIDGFTEDRITTEDNSFNTYTNYIHYILALPNANMRWAKSGNYLLKVYDNTDEKRIAFTRRFLVVESSWQIEGAVFGRTAMVSKTDTHHELDFSVNYKPTRIAYPQKDVKAYVLQNGRWDNAIGPLPPYVTRENSLVYDYQDKIVFPAGKEWRYFDIRTFNFRGDNVKIIDHTYDDFEVTLRPEQNRAGKHFIYHGDLNGRYSIENTNSNQSLLECDYARVLFSLELSEPFPNQDVYLFGELTDWQLKPEFRLAYNEELKVYLCEALLKQGYYNYQYLVVDRQTGAVDEEGVEGNWYETSNQYTILVYYRPFGERYDHLMTARTIESGSH